MGLFNLLLTTVVVLLIVHTVVLQNEQIKIAERYKQELDLEVREQQIRIHQLEHSCYISLLGE